MATAGKKPCDRFLLARAAGRVACVRLAPCKTRQLYMAAAYWGMRGYRKQHAHGSISAGANAICRRHFSENPKKPTMPHSSTHQHAGAYGANLASLITLTFLLCMLVTPLNAHAKKHKTQKASTHQTSASKGAGKTTYRPSPSEESRAERERRLFRECRGMPNAGACRGFTQR